MTICCNIWEKFDEKNMLIREYRHWKLLLGARSKTLGYCIAVTKEHHESLGNLSSEEMAEYSRISADVESALRQLFPVQKIHHMLLMFYDDHTHFHIMPRYGSPVSFAGFEWFDDDLPPIQKKAWKKAPDHSNSTVISKIKEAL